MSLKYKVSLFVSALFLVSGLASLLVNQLVILPSFVQLEQEQAQRNTARSVEAINRDLEVLSTNVTAWAQWDESMLFMEGQNDAFIAGELSAEAVASAEISYMGFYRISGEQVTYRAPASETTEGASFGVLQAPSLPSDHPLLQHATVRSDAKGLVATPSGPMLVASRPIVHSSGEGPAAGVLIFGRLFDEATRQRIATQYKLDLAIGPPTWADEEHATPLVMPAEADPTEPRRLSAIRLDASGDTITGETTIADLHGDPILTMRVRTSREISKRGAEASRIALGTLGGVALAVLGVLLALINVTVLSPIAKLTAHAVDVGRNDALGKRLALDRKDELGVLASEFDRMTDSLVEARQRLIDQSFVFGKAEMASGILHNLGNAVTPIMVRLSSLSDRIKSAPCDELERAVAELTTDTGTPERRADLARFVQLAGVELVALLREAQEHARGAMMQVEHVQQILGEQERFSRAGAIAEEVDLDAIVRRVTRGLSPALVALFELEVDPSVREVGPVLAPRVELQQIVGNLLLNAAESIQLHCISNGRIRVSAIREDGPSGPLAHLRLADNGAGIAPGDLAQLFHRRFSTKQRGSGLGLHWSANAVAAFGGRLFAESAGAGQGAVLHLSLPLASAATSSASRPAGGA